MACRQLTSAQFAERRFDFRADGLCQGAAGTKSAAGGWIGSGWHLVFNNEPDAWGSQHDPKFDVAEIELTHSQDHDASRPFGVALEPTAADRGRLLILWGPHEWTADFVVAMSPSE